MIELNVTLWIQLGNFLITLVVLNWLLVRPIRDMLSLRKKTTSELLQAVDTFTAEGDALLARYEEELASARLAANQHRKEAKAEAEAAGRALLYAASLKAHEVLHAQQETIRGESDTARRSLQSEMPVFTDAALNKLLS